MLSQTQMEKGIVSFSKEDDAERYAGCLKQKLSRDDVVEIEEKVAISACYSIIIGM